MKCPHSGRYPGARVEKGEADRAVAFEAEIGLSNELEQLVVAGGGVMSLSFLG